ncbi:acyltransferase [Streptomyces monticola]|uniref:Acyltransferase n=1 Tax=Streptomyces monticola TaxID=2666263 RepID=A0ABW2JRP4_9ACTN
MTAAKLGGITASRPARFRFAYLGEGVCLAFPPGALFGEQRIAIGQDTLVGIEVSMSAGLVPGQDLGPDLIVEIGRRCTIGRGSPIVGHHSVWIGDDVFIAPYAYITDQNHSFGDPGRPIGIQPPVNHPVTIGDGCWLGAGVIVLPGTQLGRNVVVAGGAVVRGAVPDHCVVAGVPARIVRRYVPGCGWEPTPRDRKETA